MLRFLTAGESHGEALVAVLDGMPAGLSIDLDAITAQLRRRQGGYGRGRRMAIESDQAEVLSGVRGAETIGSPIALLIRNRDWENFGRAGGATASADRRHAPLSQDNERDPLDSHSRCESCRSCWCR